MTNDAVFAMAMAFSGISRNGLYQATRYQEFLTRAQAVGMTDEQAKFIVDDEKMVGGSFDDVMRRADQRFHQFLEYGYMPMVLRDVLTWDEIDHTALNSETPLNDWRWMPRPLGRQFAEISRDRQRAVVKAAIELTAQLGGPTEGWSLERAMAAVMPHVEEA